MISQDNLRAKFLQYLAHKLPEDERTVFEQQLLTHPDFSDAVAAQEQELIDAYAAGALAPEEVQCVRSWIKAYPKRMQRAGMARALLFSKSQKVRRKRLIAIVLAAAACMLMTIGISLRVTTNSNSEVPTGPIANTIPSRNQSNQSVENAQEPAVILLVAERIRGTQPITTYNIRPDVPVQLQVMLVSGSANTSYTLKITSLDGDQHTLLQKQNLSPQLIEGRLYIKATFPPGSLPPATYSASVSRGGEVVTANFTVKS